MRIKNGYVLLILVTTFLAFARFLPCPVQAQTVDIAVTAIDIGGSGAGDINAWLISQPYHAPKVGVPYMKLNKLNNNTRPLVNVNATVTRADTGGSVLVYVDFQLVTPALTVWSLGGTTILLDGPSSEIVGPVTISIPAPDIAVRWTLQVTLFVLSDMPNINPSPNWVDTSLYMLGYCDTNKDNVVDGKDYVRVVSAIPSTTGSPRWNWLCDLDGSGSVTVADYVRVTSNIPTVYPLIP